MKSNFLFLITIYFFFACGCKTTELGINVITEYTDYPIIIRKPSKSSDNISYIRFAEKIKFTNNSKTEKSFKRIEYKYNNVPKNKSLGLVLFEENNNSLHRISNNKKKVLSRKNSLEYIFHTRHYIDSSTNIQNYLKNYIDKMLKENKDTLHIGTIQEFKKTHKELFEKLTKNDSISIQFLDGKKLGERVTVPVKW